MAVSINISTDLESRTEERMFLRNVVEIKFTPKNDPDQLDITQKGRDNNEYHHLFLLSDVVELKIIPKQVVMYMDDPDKFYLDLRIDLRFAKDQEKEGG